jgi:hypothetical protein
MEMGAKGGKSFLMIMRLAGLPPGEGDVTVMQEGAESAARRKVVVRWER